MSATIHTNYRGWNIAVRCINCIEQQGSKSPYTVGSALAVLANSDDGHLWTDCRPQKETLVDRFVSPDGACSHALLERVRILIDSLGTRRCEVTGILTANGARRTDMGGDNEKYQSR